MNDGQGLGSASCWPPHESTSPQNEINIKLVSKSMTCMNLAGMLELVVQ